MYDLAQAIRLKALYVYYNIFWFRMTPEEFVAEIQHRPEFETAVARNFGVMIGKRREDNPWLYYGDRY